MHPSRGFSMTWSVKDGGRLCECGHMKCEHEEGNKDCRKCSNPFLAVQYCETFRDRATETANG